MRTLTENELNEVLRKHRLWLNSEEEGERADLSGASLSGADLYGADLYGADLSGADLRSANLSRADLSETNLYRAILREADMSGACLSGADMSEADLRRADLRSANLSRADRSANLSGADLRSANLGGVYLKGANLSGANLSGARSIPYIPLSCPEEGSFIGFKKAMLDGNYIKPVIVKLLIPEDAKRSSATTNKCRCSKAKVLQIQTLEGVNLDVIACSKHDFTFKYKIGEIVEVKDFDKNRFVECGAGIHFFINRQDAVDY